MSNNSNKWFDDFLETLRNNGWNEVFGEHGWDLSTGSSHDTLSINREKEGFNEFAKDGNKAICPGDPALSLLYHALMHPGVKNDSITFWPDLKDIDHLENYIYGLKYDSLSEEESKELLSLVPVVLTYEYRVTRRTPHGKHSDLVYSRTGVGRVGTHDHEYSGERRCFNTDVNDNSGGTRVQPARYGVFLCRECNVNEVSVQGKRHSKDNQRKLYQPVYKMFDGMRFDDKQLSVSFESFHQNDKLSRMVSKGRLSIHSSFDIDKPPFFYRSNRDDFVKFEWTAGNLVVWSKPQNEICRIAKQNDSIVTFKVPPENLLWLKPVFAKFKIGFFHNNRRYTSLRVGQSLLWASIDLGLNALFKMFGSDKRVFLSPRHAGEFTNIRHILDDYGEVMDLNYLPVSLFKKIISAGGYQAIMYEDPVAEGYISATLKGLGNQDVVAKPAYSLMTAPDFMPRVGNIDIYQYEKLFVEGGPRALCEGRLPVNLRLTYQATQQPVFSPDEETLTAITAIARAQKGSCQGVVEYDNTHYLTDEASDVFAPGWDVTYTRDSIFSPPYYHTSGLGAPFLEDVKLCAAANGMWPAASPDAARTFKRDTPTAFPLTDFELGLAPESALSKSTNSSNTGWDGEHGPYIEKDEDGKLVVNYASIERSDYISNYANKLINFSNLRQIGRPEADKRMADLAAVYEKLLNGKPLKKSDFWLVSFVKIQPGDKPEDFVNVPTLSWKTVGLSQSFLAVNHPGYFYIFAQYSQGSHLGKTLNRRIQPVNTFTFVKTSSNPNQEVITYPS